MNADIWEAIPALLKKGENVAVATIATQDGSTPRSAGTKMLVGPGGILAGTLGGGLAEAMAIEEGKKVLADGEPRMLPVDMTGSAKDGADLICGGRVTIFIQRLEPEHLAVFETLRERMRLGGRLWLLSLLRERGGPVVVVPEEGEAGTLGEALARMRPEGARLFAWEGREYLLESLAGRTRLVLAGGGHVSLATSRMATEVGFEVTVVDDREEFANGGRFPWLRSGRTLVVEGFRDCLSEATLGFRVDAGCFVAILTRGHLFDGEVLGQALRTGAGYIGMIGSRRKRDGLYGELEGRGFLRGEFGRVYCPIGLGIGAETPEEIGVSIVAELIAVRAGKEMKR